MWVSRPGRPRAHRPLPPVRELERVAPSGDVNFQPWRTEGRIQRTHFKMSPEALGLPIVRADNKGLYWQRKTAEAALPSAKSPQIAAGERMQLGDLAAVGTLLHWLCSGDLFHAVLQEVVEIAALRHSPLGFGSLPHPILVINNATAERVNSFGNSYLI